MTEAWRGGRVFFQVLVLSGLVAAPALADDDASLSNLIDNSIGYLNIAPGLVLIESETGSDICRIRVEDGFFDAYADDSNAGMNAFAPTIICVPTREFER